LGGWEKAALGGLALAALLFGVLVEVRSCFLSRRMGDLDCYLRAAWAVRTGRDLYAVTDEHRWHYNYPPLLAILLVPLADPPPGADRSGMVPYPVAVAIWYLFNLACVALSVHWLASAVEQTAADPAVRRQPAGCRRWWALRVLPVLACLTPIGHTLMRGQVNLLVLALLSAAAAGLLRGRSLRAGFCLAGAACLKVIPAFLVLFLLWKRDGRCLLGFIGGMLVGVVLIPAAVFGPGQTVTHYRTYAQVLLAPALVGGADQSRARELLAAEATFSQSLPSTLHNLLHPDPQTRPRFPTPALRAGAWLVGLLLTAGTLWRGRRVRADNGLPALLVFGALAVLMLLLSPVCHRHYFCLALPLALALIAGAWERKQFPALEVMPALVLAINLAILTLTHLPGGEWLRDTGAATFAALLLWLTALVQLGRASPANRRVLPAPIPLLAA
jgi:hypothetical protein